MAVLEMGKNAVSGGVDTPYQFLSHSVIRDCKQRIGASLANLIVIL